MSILIKGGEILDGSGAPPKKADILIVGDRITAIGDLATYKANKIISAAGSYIFPGFIDISLSSTNSRFALFTEPHQANYIQQGVTSIISSPYGITAFSGWQDTKEYLQAVKRLHLNINFSTFLNYENVRYSITNRIRELGKKEIIALSHIIEFHLKNGAAGLSFGTRSSSDIYINEEEKKSIAHILSVKNKPIFCSYKPRDKSYEFFVESGIKTIIHGLNESCKNIIAFNKIVSYLEKMSLKTEFAFVCLPYPYFQFSAADILPPVSYGLDINNHLESLTQKRGFNFFSKQIQGLNLQETFIFDIPKKEARFLLGKSVIEFMENRGLSKEEAFIKIITLCGKETIFLSRMPNSNVLDKIIMHPQSIVSGFVRDPMFRISDIHKEVNSPFIEFIRASDRLGIRIENVSKKLASISRLIGLKKRGLIKEGHSADIVILKNLLPDMILVNGQVAYEDGKTIENRSGRILVNN